MPAGRPTDYKPEYCQMMIDMMRTGLGFASFADSVNVCRDTLDEWARIHPEFSDAKRVAKNGKASAWERRINLNKDDPNSSSDTRCIFMLKNAAPDEYSDRQQPQPAAKDDASEILNNCSPETLSMIGRDMQRKKNG